MDGVSLMLPTLSIGSIALPVAPLVTIAGFWVALWLIARVGRRFGLAENVVYNAGFIGVVTGLIGARLWYALQYWPFYRDHPADIIALNLHALSVLGGMLVGTVCAVIYLQRKSVPALPLLDALAPGLAAFAIALSLANFASGAAYGEPTRLPWAIHLWDTARHPTQLYDLALSFGILLVSLRLVRAGPATGRAFVATVALLAGSRLLTEGFRGDSSALDGGWRVMQFVWLALLLAALMALAWIDTRRASTRALSPDTEVANE